MRVTLETEALRLSVALQTPEHLARLEGYVAEMEPSFVAAVFESPTQVVQRARLLQPLLAFGTQ